MVNGSFDENTSITPAKFRTTSTAVYAGTLDEVSLQTGAVSFNGTSQYLSTSNATAFNFGTGDFTVECWFYCTTAPGGSNYATLITQAYPTDSQGIYLGLFGANQIGWLLGNGAWFFSSTPATTYSTNTWNHLALVRSGTTYTVYLNGTSIDSTTTATAMTYTNNSIYLGGRTYQYFTGYMSNVRVVKGTAVYTANFTPPQSILPAITNTQLLLNVTDSTNFIRDNSPNNFTVTNTGTATWTTNGPFNQGVTTVKQRQVTDGTQEVYTQFDEFTGASVVNSNLTMWLDFGQTSSYPGTGTTVTDISPVPTANVTLTGSPTFSSTDGGGSEAFNGTSQYGTGTGTPLGLSAYTKSFWFKLTSYGTGNNVVSSDVGGHFSYFGGGNKLQNGHSFWANYGAFTSVTTFSLNTWYHACVTFNTATGMALYVNGVLDSTYVSTTTNPTNTPVTGTGRVDIANYGAGNFLTGSIGQVMVYTRALTADEVTTNFNALRNRYGI